MDKNAIKKYAIWARNELIAKVSQKAATYGIEKVNMIDANVDSIDGVMLSSVEKKQRKALIEQINEKGYEQVIEEVAYTWFNRFTAIRFMEVNGYLPSHIRVFTDDDNNFKPQILTEAIHLNDVFEKINMEKVFELKQEDKTEELYKYLLIVQCNALNAVLPRMFQKIEDYTELLLPDFLLREGSIIEQMISVIPENSFNVKTSEGQVEIIGWLYQYYNTDLFNSIFDGDKSRKSLKANDIPAATQLFTPDWAVRYMVDNSVGKYWIDGHPNSSLREKLKYYLSAPEQQDDVKDKINSINESKSKKDIKDIHVLDCCMGSGHILVYSFEVLLKIYDELGYSVRDAVRSIVKNNLYGLDIDDRASQLAYFAIMMKAREYDRSFFSAQIQPNVYSIKESNDIDINCIEYFCGEDRSIYLDILSIIKEFIDAKEYGSILKISKHDYEKISNRFNDLSDDINFYSDIIKNELLTIVKISEMMSNKYEVVVTNPPYLASPRMNDKLQNYIKANYEEGKADFSTVMYLCAQRNYVAEEGYISFITTNSWMFLKSFLKVRKESLKVMSFESIVDYGTELFEGKIGHLPIIAWVARKSNIKSKFHAVRLVDFKYSRRDEKQIEFFNEKNHYFATQNEFNAIDGQPIVYWISERVINSFQYDKIESFAEIVSGMTTGDNNKYLRIWSELDINKIAFDKKNIDDIDLINTNWIPYHKGGEQRKWYGNHEYVVNWAEKNNFNRAKTTMTHVYLKPCITWSDISGNTFAGRYCYGGFLFDVKGSCAFSTDDNLKILMAIFNSKIMPVYVEALNPTTTTQVGDIKRVPYIKPNEFEKRKLIEKVDECIEIAKNEWDSFEFSWDFVRHPLIVNGIHTIKESFDVWKDKVDNWIIKTQKNEEDINRILINMYGLNDELSSDIDTGNITLRKPDLLREIKSLISYSVGCMFGRYSIDFEGIAFAGGIWDLSKYSSFLPDKDGIIPISDDEYFKDDIVGQFIRFIEIVYGKKNIEENLRFIAEVLGGKGTPRQVIRNYFMNDFYSDHLKTYMKKPIYWQFDSGKKNGFKCLMYIHRYKNDTVARIRTDYVHEQQSRYRTAIENLMNQLKTASPNERIKINKQLSIIKEKADEVMVFEEKIHHLADQMKTVDLNDGVVQNYKQFESVLTSI